MKKTMALLAIAFCLVIGMSVSAVAADECALGGFSSTDTGWWVIDDEQVGGVFAVAFTAPQQFDGMNLGLMCGPNAPVNFTLYKYDGSSIETTVAGTPLFSTNTVVNGDHNAPETGNGVVCEFDKVYGAGRYVFAVRYGAEAYVTGAHLCVVSTDACTDEELDVVFWFDGFIVNEKTMDGFAGFLLLSDEEPEYDPNASTGGDSSDDTQTNPPQQGNAGTADSSMLFAAVVALAAVATVVLRKKTAK